MDVIIKQLTIFPVSTSTETDDDKEERPSTDRRTKSIQFAQQIAAEAELIRQVQANILINQSIWDGLVEFDVLDSSKARKRDWELLKQKDTEIKDALQKIVSEKMTSRIVPESLVTTINSEFESLWYMNLWTKWDTFIIAEKSYAEVAWMLWQLNAVFKELHGNSWFHGDLQDIWTSEKVWNQKDPEEAIFALKLEKYWIVLRRVHEITNRHLLELSDWKAGDSFERIAFTNGKKDFVTEIRQIQQDYNCAYWIKSQCDDSIAWWWKKAAEEWWEEVRETVMTDWGNAIDTFKTSFSRLKWALFIWNDDDKDAAAQRQNQLLWSYYTTDLPEYKKWRELPWDEKDANVTPTPVDWTTLKKFFIRRFKTFPIDLVATGDPTPRRLTSWVQFVWSMTKKEWRNDFFAKTKEEKEAFIEKFEEWEVSAKKYRWDEESIDQRSILSSWSEKVEVASFRAAFDDVILMQREFEKQTILVDPLEFTNQFPALSQSVYKNMQLIGTKEDEDKWYHSMWNVCKAQCAESHNWRCWFY